MIRVHFPPSIPGKDEIEIVPAVRSGMDGYRGTAWHRRHLRLFEHAHAHFVASSLDEADVVFYPHMFESDRAGMRAVEAANRRGIPIIVVKTGDAATPLRLPGAIVYRHSIFGARRVPGEFALPAFCDDPLAGSDGEVPIRTLRPRPSVGFCGYVSSAPMRLLYRLAGRVPKADGLSLRADLLRRLERHPGLDARFIRNDQFLGGMKGVTNPDPSVAERARRPFLQNLFGTDYALAVRGAGNFSYRFYEVFSAGRIPLYVDTDTVLPYEDEIDWRSHCVWVEQGEIPVIGDKLIEFHRTIDPDAFEDLQRRNRKLWEDYLTPLPFYRRALAAAISREPPTASGR